MLSSGVLFRLSSEFVKSYEHVKPPFGFNGLGELVYLRTYSRTKDDGSKEKWFETIERVVNGTYSIQKRHMKSHRLPWDEKKAQKSAQEMYDRMFNMKFLPPGRGLWAMGAPVIEERGLAASLNNCSFVSTEKLSDNPTLPFTFMMDALMLGVGVGFDTKGANTVKVFRPLDEPGEVVVIPDSREGWIDSLEVLLWAFFKPGQKIPTFDYSEIRPAGSPIKGFGGLASGHGILKDCHDYVRDLLLSYTDGYFERSMSDRLIVDLMNLIGKCIVSGNVRRSSQIALGDPDSKDYLDLKNYSVNPDRATFGWASNNSIYSSLGQDYKDISDRIRINGEPGLLWVENARNHGRMMDPPDTKDIRSSGTNPCKPSKSLVLTDCGYKTIGKLFEESSDTITVMTPNGWKSATKPFKTRESTGVWKIKLSDGTFLYGTANHVHQMSDGQRKRVDELKVGDLLSRFLVSIYDDFDIINQTEYENGLLAGWFHAEGSVVKSKDRENGYQFRLFFGNHEFDVEPLFEQIVGKRAKPHNQKPDTCHVITTRDNSLRDRLFGFGYELDKNNLTWLYGKTKEFKIGFLRSVFTADGSVRLKTNGGGTELYSVRYSSLEVMCNILKEFGIHSTICVHGNARRTEYSYGVRNNSTTYKIKIPNSQFSKIGFLSEYKSELLLELVEISNLDNHYLTSKFDNVMVVSISIDDSVEDVYCLTVNDKDHLFVDTGVLTSNCAEMTLESYELCCLVETFPYKHENYQDFARTLKFAYLYAKTVTLLATHWPETNKVMMRNRRIGCSMSGIAQFLSNRGVAELRSWCENGYKEIKRWDNTYSEWLAVPKSNRVTTVKPSGSVSLLCGSTPGVHFPESRFYIRRVRLAKNSDLVEPLRIAGYHIEDAFGDHNTVVVEIPVDSGPGVRSVSEVPMWEQLTLASMLQEVWSDNSVSVTISFDPFHEGHQIEHALKYFQYKLKTVSFLPRVAGGAYPQMPYEEITEERYLELISNLSNAVFDSFEAAEMTDKYCSGDKCVVNL